MTKYLLLRDNKESGPYSFDELKEKGLKAYDLVWVEGKSAAWRYPCEVEELSAFAPAVEEQPFDRFYKKPAQQSGATPPTVQLKQVPEKDNSPKIAVSISGSATSVFSGEPSAVPGKRIIYVTLPAGRTAPANKETSPRETARIPVVPSPVDIPGRVQLEQIRTGIGTEIRTGIGHIDEGHNRENGNAGVEILPRAGKKRPSSKVLQPVAVVLCILALLAAGIFIGLSINKYNLASTQKIALKNAATDRLGTVDHRVSNLPAPVVAVPPPPALAADVPNNDAIKSTTPTEPPVTNLKKTTGAKDKSSLPGQKTQSALSSSAKDSAMMALTVSHREASYRADQPVEKIDKDILRNNISNLVSVGTNGYNVGTFGGITGVQLTVSNKSVYPLDLVVVEIQYIQANKKVFKTENLYFRGIGPGSALMQEAPNSTRGIKVQYKITLVNSKELGLSYSAL